MVNYIGKENKVCIDQLSYHQQSAPSRPPVISPKDTHLYWGMSVFGKVNQGRKEVSNTPGTQTHDLALEARLRPSEPIVPEEGEVASGFRSPSSES